MRTTSAALDTRSRSLNGMKSTALIVASLVCTAAPDLAATAPQHTWKSIHYPAISVPWSVDGKAYVSLQPGTQGLQLDVTMGLESALGKEPGKGELQIRLHREPRPTALVDLEWAGATSTGDTAQHHHMHEFPWGADQLVEAWLELRAGERTYWLEIPYGFDRDPSRPIAGSSAPTGGPKLAGAMDKLSESAAILPWQHVQYEIGKIQNGWHLTALQSNTFDATTELILYWDDGRVGSSAYRWDLHEPRTAVSVAPVGEQPVGSRCMQLKLNTDGLRRSDTFALFRNVSDRRGWGTLNITVGEHAHELVLPSSLYCYTHGVAEPHHAARTR